MRDIMLPCDPAVVLRRALLRKPPAFLFQTHPITLTKLPNLCSRGASALGGEVWKFSYAAAHDTLLKIFIHHGKTAIEFDGASSPYIFNRLACFFASAITVVIYSKGDCWDSEIVVHPFFFSKTKCAGSRAIP